MRADTAKVWIGDKGKRAVIALYLTPEHAEQLAQLIPPAKDESAELRAAAALARAILEGTPTD